MKKTFTHVKIKNKNSGIYYSKFKFQVFHENGVVIEGYIIVVAGKKFASMECELTAERDNPAFMLQDDIYKVFYERGFEYK
jgi:hypothetical protein